MTKRRGLRDQYLGCCVSTGQPHTKQISIRFGGKMTGEPRVSLKQEAAEEQDAENDEHGDDDDLY